MLVRCDFWLPPDTNVVLVARVAFVNFQAKVQETITASAGTSYGMMCT